MSHKKFGPDRFSRFDAYWIQTDRQTDKQTDKPNLYIDVTESPFRKIQVYLVEFEEARASCTTLYTYKLHYTIHIHVLHYTHTNYTTLYIYMYYTIHIQTTLHYTFTCTTLYTYKLHYTVHIHTYTCTTLYTYKLHYTIHIHTIHGTVH